jgi:Wzt C-terminal domain
VRVVDAWLEDPDGARIENVEQDVPIGIGVVFEARHDLRDPVFGLHFVNADGDAVFGLNRTLREGHVPAGGRVRVSGRIENPLLPGRYSVSCMISRNRTQGDLALHVVRLLDFVVYGTRSGPGDVAVRADVEAELEC